MDCIAGDHLDREDSIGQERVPVAAMLQRKCRRGVCMYMF